MISTGEPRPILHLTNDLAETISTFLPRPILDITNDLQELRRRMGKPQRHRLLHGYPLAAAMPSVDHRNATRFRFSNRTDRGLLIGVLPHPYCNPTVSGCGFCTFPHQRYRTDQAEAVVERVLLEIDQRIAAEPDLLRRPVTALYFGGATANLTPPESFRKLCRKLNHRFDLSNAEVTLEGAPIYFVKKAPSAIDVMREEIEARHFRVSMGIQTFDRQRLKQMGRLPFGTRSTFQDVVKLCHKYAMTVSGDLLFNLPYQSKADMEQDVRDAIEIGLDHIGLYHLVMFRGLGTPWARDKTMLAGLPDNNEAAGNWLALQRLLGTRAFVQTTLTNFERAQYRGSDTRFLYEECSFQPAQYDMLGFGSSAISFSAGNGFRRAWKTINPESAEQYIRSVDQRDGIYDRYFNYSTPDLSVFYLTRRLAALHISRRDYRLAFGRSPVTDYPREFAALERKRLIEITGESIRPTPLGMFFADSIAALLAWRRLNAIRSKNARRTADLPRAAGNERANTNAPAFM